MKTRAGGVIVLCATLAFCDRPEEQSDQKSSVDPKVRASVVAFWSAYRAGRALAQEGEWSAARDSLDAALTLDPTHEGALYDVGNVCFELTDYAGAEDAWRRLVDAHPNSVRGYAQLGALFSCGLKSAPFDLSEAEKSFTRMFDLNKESMEASVRLGEVFLLQGRTDDALKWFSQAIAFDRSNREAWILKGLALWSSGDRDGAVLAYAGDGPEETVERPFASEEGDTRTGSSPMLAEGARHRGFFRQTIDQALGGATAEHVYSDATARMNQR